MALSRRDWNCRRFAPRKVEASAAAPKQLFFPAPLPRDDACNSCLRSELFQQKHQQEGALGLHRRRAVE